MCFLMTAAIALPSFGCAYERAKRSGTEATSHTTAVPTTLVSTDPKDVNVVKNSADLFYSHDVIPLEEPNLKQNEADVCDYRLILSTTFLNNVLLVHEVSGYYTSSQQTAASGHVDPELELGIPVSPSDEDVEYYFLDIYAIYDLEGNLLGTIDAPDDSDIYDIGLFQSDPDGNIVHFFEEYDDAAATRYICMEKFAKNGKSLGEKRQLIMMPSEGTIDRIIGALISIDGDIIIVTSSEVYKFTSDYFPKTKSTFGHLEHCICRGITKESNVYYVELEYEENYTTKSKLFSFSDFVDTNSGDLSANTETDADNLSSMKVFQSSTGLYAMTKNALGKISLSTGEFRQIIDWNQTDVERCILNDGTMKVLRNGQMGQPIKMLQADAVSPDNAKTEDDDSTVKSKQIAADILVCATENTDEGNRAKLVHIYESDKNPHVGQTVVWVGGVDFSDENFCKAVSKFNQDPSNDVWIKMTDYSDYTFYDVDRELAKDKAVEALYSQMLSGSGPDIIYGVANYKKFDKSRLLTDLNPYMDSLNGVNRTDYFENILSAFETDGKLYQIPVSFYVDALFWNPNVATYSPSKRSIAGMAESVFSLPEEIYMLTKYGGEMSAFQLLARHLILNKVNYSTGEIELSDDDLAYLLEILGAGYSEDPVYYNEFEPSESWFAVSSDIYQSDPQSAFMPISINSLWKFLTQSQTGMFLTGYPNAQGEGYVAKADISLGIASYSNNTEKAWDFVRYMISEKAQSDLCFWNADYKHESKSGMPINKSVYLPFIEEHMNQESVADYFIPEIMNGPEAVYKWDSIDLEGFVDFIGKTDKRYVTDSAVEINVVDQVYQILIDEKSVFEAVADLRDAVRKVV